ncbi:MAG: PH domain-containing protein [Micrococcaceae bacterium]
MLPPSDYRQWLLYGVYIIAGIATLYFVIAPFFRWFGTSYTLTSKRVILKKGILNSKELDARLDSIASIEVSRNVMQRLYGRSGNIIFYFRDKRPALKFHNVPEARRFRNIIQTLLRTEYGAVPKYEPIQQVIN